MKPEAKAGGHGWIVAALLAALLLAGGFIPSLRYLDVAYHENMSEGPNPHCPYGRTEAGSGRNSLWTFACFAGVRGSCT